MLVRSLFPLTLFDGEEGGNGGAGTGTQNPPPAQQQNGGEGTGRADARIREALEAKEAAEKAAKEAQDKLAAIEQQNESAVEKAAREKAEAEDRANAAEKRANRLERKGWATQAAIDAGFRNPEDAVLRVDLDAADSEAKVKNRIEALSKDENLSYLLLKEGEQRPRGFGAPAGGSGGGPPAGGGGDGAPGSGGEITDEEGNPDVKANVGRGLLHHLTGGGSAG